VTEAVPQLLKERPVQLHGSRVAHTLLRLAGWRLDFDGLPAQQGVIAVYPHTSNWDFVLGIFAKWAIGVSVVFWGKDSLFRVPLFGRWLRWLGGVPVDRASARGVVGDMVSRMQEAREQSRFCWLALSPEGTRSLTQGWRSGFYNVCLGADVPLALAHLDYATHRVGVATCLRLSGNRSADMAAIEQHIGWSRGYRPELAAPIRLT
jgi:1-acyl-sn-glycerol-3-phosphate acyltransferase